MFLRRYVLENWFFRVAKLRKVNVNDTESTVCIVDCWKEHRSVTFTRQSQLISVKMLKMVSCSSLEGVPFKFIIYKKCQALRLAVWIVWAHYWSLLECRWIILISKYFMQWKMSLTSYMCRPNGGGVRRLPCWWSPWRGECCTAGPWSAGRWAPLPPPRWSSLGPAWPAAQSGTATKSTFRNRFLNHVDKDL